MGYIQQTVSWFSVARLAVDYKSPYFRLLKSGDILKQESSRSVPARKRQRRRRASCSKPVTPVAAMSDTALVAYGMVYVSQYFMFTHL
jgi:hypothetical protein